MEYAKAEGAENLGTGRFRGKLHCLFQAFWVPVLEWDGTWFAEVLSSVRNTREGELGPAASRGV